MNIRRAQEKDIPRLIELLEQVLQIHADIRPDIFIPGTTKYTNEELAEMIKDDTKPIYVAADDDDVCMGYAFCQIRQHAQIPSLRSGSSGSRQEDLSSEYRPARYPHAGCPL